MTVAGRTPLNMRLGHITPHDYCDECHRLLRVDNGTPPFPIGENLWRFWPVTPAGKLLCDNCANERDPLMMSFIGFANLIASIEGLDPLSDKYLSPGFVPGERLGEDDIDVELLNYASYISAMIYEEMEQKLGISRESLIAERQREQAAQNSTRTFYMRQRSNYQALRDKLRQCGFSADWFNGYVSLQLGDEYVEITLLGQRQYIVKTEGASSNTINLILQYAEPARFEAKISRYE